MKNGLLGIMILLGMACSSRPNSADQLPNNFSKMNILFINDEDLSTRAVGAYGNPVVKTPFLDALAQKGVLFEQAICQAPMCNPSRASFLTGCRPEQTKIFNNQDLMYERTDEVIKGIAGILRKQGVQLANIGKLYHGREKNTRYKEFDFLAYSPKPEGYQGEFYKVPKEPCSGKRFDYSSDPIIEAELHRRKVIFDQQNKIVSKTDPEWWFEVGIPYIGMYFQVLGDSGVPESCDEDFKKARLAGEKIKEYAKNGKQFFLSVGFSKPHTPIVAPKNYVDLYDPEQIELPLNVPEKEKNIPDASKRFGAKADVFTGWFDNEFPQLAETPVRQKEAIAAYFGAASFIDAQVGYMLQVLEETGQTDNTIIVFFSDHGFHLGEHGLWSKYSQFDEVLRVPLIIYIPGMDGNGKSSPRLVELVDLLPTLCELWQVEKPSYLDGQSLVPLLKDPDLPFKKAAYATFDLSGVSQQDIFGYTTRTEKYRYTQWGINGEFGKELYDLIIDPLEQKNVYAQSEYQNVVKQLEGLAAIQWPD